MTCHSSTFVTAARISLALESGLTMPDENESGKFFEDLPVLSRQPIEVLTLARVRAPAWHEQMCTEAAYYGDFQLLKWLHSSGCPWAAGRLDVALHAI
jgi:hypothetical protein